MPNTTIDNNTYYPSGNITIFPSSNAVDEGKLFTEFNGRNITINITDKNYVVSPNPGGYDISYNSGTKLIDIQPGKCIINGFEANTDTVISYRLPTADEIVADASQIDDVYNGFALLCLQTMFDAQTNLCGNVQVGADWFCTGIRVVYASLDEYLKKPNEYLLLGGIKEDGTTEINDDKYTRIDAKYIFIKIEGDPETGAPPTQTTDLFTFINNFLHGYWVSKAGDNEYGELLFKSEPANYFEKDFDYKTEDPLTSNKFAVKIFRTTNGFIVIKPETEANTNHVTQFLPGILGFYKGLYKGDTNTTFEEYVQASANKLNSSVYNTTNLLELVVNNGVIRLKSKSAQGPVFSIETNKATHNGVEIGKVVYANGTGSDIEDSDSTTKYNNTINYLVDAQGRIKTVDAATLTRYIVLDTVNNSINVTEPTTTATKRPTVNFQAGTLYGVIKLGTQNNVKGSNNSAWTNVLELSDNIKIVASNNKDNLGSLQATGYIVAGTQSNPATIQVPDIANSGGNRTLKSGDIYGTQVWSAVYNDYAEIFRIHQKDVNKIKSGMILAVDENNPDYYVLADKDNTCVVGVVSENPAYCAGGDDCEYGVPVALAGRVKVKFKKTCYTPRIGSFAEINFDEPGYCTCTLGNRKSFGNVTVGKIIKIIDDETVEIIVSLG